MDRTRAGLRRRRLAPPVAGLLGLVLSTALAGCTSTNQSVSATSTTSSAPNGPGQWTTAQIQDAESLLMAPPVGQDSAEARCLVRYAAATLSWQQFGSYVEFLQGDGGIATPSGDQGAVVGAMSNYAVKCGKLFVSPEPGAPGGGRPVGPGGAGSPTAAGSPSAAGSPDGRPPRSARFLSAGTVHLGRPASSYR